MLWELVTRNLDVALTLDIVFFMLAIAFAVMLFYFKWKMGPWWKVANAKMFVLAVGRDKMARIIIPRPRAGQFLDLGRYGKIFVDPANVYRIYNATGNQAVVVTYLPYAIALDVEKLAAMKKFREGKDVKYAEKQVETDEGVKMVKVPYVEIKEPMQVSIEDIENWQVYSYNPILLDVAIKEEARAYERETKAIFQQLRIMIIIVLMISILGFIMMFVR